MNNKIIIINGPNLNLLGEREQSQYGSTTFEELKMNCLKKSNEIGINLEFAQSNIEGELVSLIQHARNEYDGMIINAAGFTHTSVAIRDALDLFKKPIIELHMIDLPPEVSNAVYARMSTEREREARDHRSRGRELAEGIEADADRQNTVIEANAYREAEQIRGEGDAIASEIYATAYNQDPEFYAFHRSIQAYQDSFAGKEDLLVIDPESDFFRYLKDPTGK